MLPPWASTRTGKTPEETIVASTPRGDDVFVMVVTLTNGLSRNAAYEVVSAPPAMRRHERVTRSVKALVSVQMISVPITRTGAARKSQPRCGTSSAGEPMTSACESVHGSVAPLMSPRVCRPPSASIAMMRCV